MWAEKGGLDFEGRARWDEYTKNKVRSRARGRSACVLGRSVCTAVLCAWERDRRDRQPRGARSRLTHICTSSRREGYGQRRGQAALRRVLGRRLRPQAVPVPVLGALLRRRSCSLCLHAGPKAAIGVPSRTQDARRRRRQAVACRHSYFNHSVCNSARSSVQRIGARHSSAAQCVCRCSDALEQRCLSLARVNSQARAHGRFGHLAMCRNLVSWTPV